MRQTLLRRATSDPWAKRDAWRYEGHFSKKFMYRNLWPGFTYGVGAFVVYVVAEKLFFPPQHHHEESHDEHH
ncbi:CYFA0S03e01024g1_1 [Cyberlindnera fabianii]|uniref:CYFA0S03e01024g1_1 n=1 Tax=Cyberlindnera fabianii TaxID=36022 RepID=A0A061AWY1_CYBFA|nr:CYFA0S03e01024g1_1 [Cyberlindnera fabianii]